jgi:NAD(P)-dependent dehydrogenase (short-subunit alcohol dehydrogenase family)
MSGRLQGKVAVITGAGRGIGRATARRFAAEGASVVVADISADLGRGTVELVGADGGEARFVETDVTDPTSVERLIQETVTAYGGLHVLHNNAGGSTVNDGPVTEVSLDEWWRAINLNLFGTFLGCRFGIPAIVASGGGSVINMASSVGLLGTAGRDAYTAAKGGIVSLTRSMAKEYAPSKVRVNALAPGAVATERVMAMMGERANEWSDPDGGVPLMSQPADIAAAALFLASDESRTVTATIVTVDGGWVATDQG